MKHLILITPLGSRIDSTFDSETQTLTFLGGSVLRNVRFTVVDGKTVVAGTDYIVEDVRKTEKVGTGSEAYRYLKGICQNEKQTLMIQECLAIYLNIAFYDPSYAYVPGNILIRFKGQETFLVDHLRDQLVSEGMIRFVNGRAWDGRRALERMGERCKEAVIRDLEAKVKALQAKVDKKGRKGSEYTAEELTSKLRNVLLDWKATKLDIGHDGSVNGWKPTDEELAKALRTFRDQMDSLERL